MSGTIVEAPTLVGNLRSLIFTCTADENGVFPQTPVATKFEGQIRELLTTPGAVQPSSYHAKLIDQNGYDLLEELGSNRSATDAERVAILYAGTNNAPVVDETDALTLVLDNNTVPFAETTVEVRYSTGVRL